MKTEFPEILCDINARMNVNGFLLTQGSMEDLASLGLTIEQAVGMRFSFNGGDDLDEHGEPADIMFDGMIEKSDRWGYLAVSDSRGIYWRRKP
ncbi:hypothetical protein [Xanthomonas arboricola]|uniref:hypothetical protein n=1 Tax=Xanthomonas arboricola TaxID=56448 RepID=UPI0006CAE863|nr:hypothetical protein [Xanthomonas arboricola]KPN08910.1 hypothetical protein AN651_03215 [Xanthomonas arboricola]